MNKLFLFICIIISSHLFAQDYHKSFSQYLTDGDTISQLKILQEWEKNAPTDAELFTSYFNYYFFISKKEILNITTEPPTGEYLEFQDSTGQPAGFIGSSIIYDETPLQKGLDKINQGIKLYPNRLDMRFGKIYTLGVTNNWNEYTAEIIRLIKYSAKNKNSWTWTNNEPLENGSEIFFDGIQEYQIQLFDTNDDFLLQNMREIANEVLKHYPKHIVSMSNIAITYLLTKEYEKGIKQLLKAEKINPKDHIILANIAHGYVLNDDKKNAIKYYEKLLEFGDDDIKSFAKQRINDLKD